MESKLNAEAVERIAALCHGEGIEVDGVAHKMQFDPAKIAEHMPTINEMLAELPDEFHLSKGGGWSFLNLCQDRHGNQWTGMHSTMEKLCGLAIAGGVGRWMMPREMWDVLPGGMPYVAFGPSQ